MSFIEFQNTFSFLPIIPLREIEKRFPNFDANALTRWQKKGYLTKVRNRFYRLNKSPIANESTLFFIANQLYAPSYISLHSALRWYDFIPEGVFTITSISTRKTNTFDTPEGHFAYHKIKPSFFFGYQLISTENFRFKIATPEKALLDLLYFNPHLNTNDDFFELRLNLMEIRQNFQLTNWKTWLALFNARALDKRAATLLKFLNQ